MWRREWFVQTSRRWTEWSISSTHCWESPTWTSPCWYVVTSGYCKYTKVILLICGLKCLATISTQRSSVSTQRSSIVTQTPYMGHLMADLLVLIGHIYILVSHFWEKDQNNLKPLHGKLVGMTSLGEEEGGGSFHVTWLLKKIENSNGKYIKIKM